MVPSGSVEPEASKAPVSGASPEVGEAVKLAVGSWLPVTVTTVALVSLAPSSSVTVRVTV